jgi:hypothetical protein
MKVKQITVIIIVAILLVACVVAKMPGDGDSIQWTQPTPTFEFRKGAAESEYSPPPESIPTWTPPPPGPEYPAPYLEQIVPVPYP